MSPSPSPKKSAKSSSSTGAKILVTAASLATLVGGWAEFAIQQSTLNSQKSVDVLDDASQAVLDLPPLPTLVPEPSSIPVVTRPALPGSPLLTFSPLSTPVVNPPLVTVPTVNSRTIASQKETSSKAPNKPPKDPVAHTSSSK